MKKHVEWIRDTFESEEIDFLSAQGAIGGVFINALKVVNGSTRVWIDASDDPYCGCHCFAAENYDVAPQEIAADFKKFLMSKGIGIFEDRDDFDKKLEAYIEMAEAL